MPWARLERVTGAFGAIRLDFTFERPEPLPPEERSATGANYDTITAHVHIHIGGRDTAKGVPPAYVFSFLYSCLAGLARLADRGQKQAFEARFLDNPFQLDVRAEPERNLAYLTLHRPGHRPGLDDVAVPLDQFAAEIARLARRLVSHIRRHYADEAADDRRGRYFREFVSLIAADAAVAGRAAGGRKRSS
jgi:hypothetical protein